MTYIDQEFNKFISKVKISSLLLIFEHFAFYKSDHVIVIVITYFNQAFWTDYSDLKKLLIKIIKNLESGSSQMALFFLKYHKEPVVLPWLVSLTLLVINSLYPGVEVPGGLSVEKKLWILAIFWPKKCNFLTPTQSWRTQTHSGYVTSNALSFELCPIKKLVLP